MPRLSLVVDTVRLRFLRALHVLRVERAGVRFPYSSSDTRGTSA